MPTLPLGGEAPDAKLPGKVPKLQARPNRTGNRHRWTGREYQGAWENLGEGTRQNSTVTSGEGVPLLGEAIYWRSRKGLQ